MPQGDICTHLVQGSSLHQLERGGIYTAAVKAHVLVQLLLFPSIYLTQERRGVTLTATCSVAVLCTQTSPLLLLMLLPSCVRHSSQPLYLTPQVSHPFLARFQVPVETGQFRDCLRRWGSASSFLKRREHL